MNSNVKSYWVPDWTQSTDAKSSVSHVDIWQFAAPSNSYRNPKNYGAGISDIDVNYIYVNYSKKIINSGYNKFN